MTWDSYTVYVNTEDSDDFVSAIRKLNGYIEHEYNDSGEF